MAVHTPSPLATNVVTMPFSNSRLLQLADLIVSISTAMVAGHTEFGGNTLCWVKHYAGNLSREQYIVRSTFEFDVDTINPWEAPRPRVRRSHEQIH